MRRPVIGITPSVQRVTVAGWTERCALSPMAYAVAVQRARGRALLLVPDEADVRDPATLDLVDGLILTGSAGDVDPARYGAARHPETHPVEPVRDAFELALVHRAREQGLPLLGVCRGMQVINVAYGGSLVQHLPDVLGHDEHRGPPGEWTAHDVELAPGSSAARAVGDRRAEVHSHHHQGVAEVPPALRVTGWSALDGAVEALEDPAHPFLLGVQWHPEEDSRSRVIAALVAAAAGPRAPADGR